MVRSTLQKRIASALLLTTVAIQLHVSGAWVSLQSTPVFAPIVGIDQVFAADSTVLPNALYQRVLDSLPANMPTTHTIGANQDPFTVRGDVNTKLSQFGLTTMPINYNVSSALRHDATTTQAACNLFGYQTVSSSQTIWSGDGRSNFSSCPNNTHAVWNGNDMSLQSSCHGQWTSQIVCSQPFQGNATQCQDGVDNDNDGLTDFPADPGCQNPQDTDESNANPTVTITKAASVSLVQPGNSITYTITVRNNSSVMARNVRVFDYFAIQGTQLHDLPFIFQSAQGATCVFGRNAADAIPPSVPGDAHMQCDFAAGQQDIAPGDQRTITVTYVIPQNPSTCGKRVRELASAYIVGGPQPRVPFTSFVDTDVDCPPIPQCRNGHDDDGDGLVDFPNDPGCTSLQDNDEFNAPQTVDLVIQKTGPVSVVRGQPIAYAIQVRNIGAVQATNVVVTDHIPAGLVYNDGLSHSTCSQQGNTVVCTHPSLNVNQTGTFTIAFDTPAIAHCTQPVSVVNTISVTATQQDSNQGNNTASTILNPTRVDCPQIPQCSDGIDNDGDGATDLADFSCGNNPQDNDETNPKAACQDNLDNDGDGLRDFPQDPGCASLQDNDEFNAPLPACRDGIDNDGDGRTDNQDPGCSSPDDTNEGDEAACQDLRDNDNDGLIDFPFDPGCISPTDTDEFNQTQTVDVQIQKYGPPSIVRGQTIFYVIQVGNSGNAAATSVVVTDTVPTGLTYNDGGSYGPCSLSNNLVTCPIGTLPAGVFGSFRIAFDVPTIPNCSQTHTLPVVNSVTITSTEDPTTQGNNTSSTLNAPTRIDCPQAPQCSDGIDNDADGLTDFPNDPGCASLQDNDEFNAPQTQCNDGFDNDFDGRIDFPLDPGCSSPQDNNEGDEAACQDRRDNDGDGLIDWPLDPGCVSPADTDEFNAPLPQCSDGVDNDNDGRVDMFDPGCSSPQDNNESDDPQCSDRIDNDGDGRIDFPLDPGCQNAQDQNEADDPVLFGCIEIVKQTFDPHGSPLPISAQFTFILDATRVAYNDSAGNARFDNVIPGQHSVAEIIPSGWTQLSMNPPNGQVSVVAGTNCARITFQNRQVLVANAQCSDGYDNDGDGLVDYPQDTGCTSAVDNDEYNSTFVPQCRDGFDNDGDGFADFPQDVGCQNADDNNEQNNAVVAACADNVDNDGDGLKDYPADPGCSGPTDTDEFNFRGPRCSDGIDNDGDGLIDYPQDTGCTTPYDDNEYNDRLWLNRWREWWNWNW